MTTRQFNIALFGCWIAAYLLYAATCLIGYWLDTELRAVITSMIVAGIISTGCALLFGWLCIKTKHHGILAGVILAMLLFAGIKFMWS